MSSNNMDERIVKLQLNNKDFEKNAKISMKTLSDLNSSMDMTGTTKNLNKSLNSVNDNTSLIANTMEKVSKSWSLWEVVAITAISNVTNKVIDLGERLVKSLSIDQWSTGWEKFGELTKNTATLIAQGLSPDKVEENLKKLSWFADATSYSFTDMTNNISKFTATGQDLDESTTAIMGIANWAALAGQNAATASRAMYQISQAMSTGTMRYQDWKSIQNANMDTVQFREQAVQAAIEAGQLYKEADDLYRTLEGKEYSLSQLFSSEGLGDLWFSSDVMMETFKRFSSGVEGSYDVYKKYEEEGISAYEAIDKYAETIENMTDEDAKKMEEFGLAAFKAAQECRTLTDAINAIKDAVSSQFMTSFETVFGKLEEAKSLWGSVYDSLEKIFLAGGNLRNSALAMWKDLGGREDLFANTEDNVGALFQILNSLNEVVQSFRESFYEVFLGIDITSTDAASKLSEKFKMLTSSIKKFSDNLNKFILSHKTEIKNIIKIVFNGIKVVINLLNIGAKLAKSVIKSLKPLAKLLGGGTNGILNTVEKLNAKLEKFINTSKVFKKIEDSLTRVTTKLAESISKLHVLDKIKSGFDNFKTALSNNGKTVASLKKIWDALKIILSKTSKMIVNIIPKIASLLGKALTRAVYYLAKGLSKLVSAGEKLASHLKKWRSKPKTIERLGKLTDFLSDSFDKLGKTIKRLYNNAKELLTSFKFNRITNGIKSIGKSVKELGSTFTNFTSKQFNKAKSGASKKSSSFIEVLISSFKDDKSKKNLAVLEKAATISERDEILAEKRYARGLKQNERLTDATVKKTSKLQKFFEGMSSALEPIINLLKSVFGLAKALMNLLAGFLNTLTKIINKITEFLNKNKFFNKSTLTKVGVLVGIAVFVKILYDIVMTLKIIEALADTVYAFNTYIRAKAFYMMAATVKAIATSIALLSVNMYLLSKIPIKEFKKGIGRLSAILGLLVGFLAVVSALARLLGPKGEISRSTYGIFGKNADKVLERSMKTTAFSQLGSTVFMLTQSLTNLGIALYMLTFPLKKLAKINTKTFKTGFERLAMVMGMLVATLAILSASVGIFGKIKNPRATLKLIGKSTKSLLGISASLIIVQYAMEKISNMKSVDYKTGLKRIAWLFAGLSAYMVLMASIYKDRKWEVLVGDSIRSGSSMMSSSKAINGITAQLIVIAGAMAGMVYAATKIGKVSWGEIGKLFTSIAIMIAFFGVISAIITMFKRRKEIKIIEKLTTEVVKPKNNILVSLKDVGMILMGLSALFTSIAISMLVYRELSTEDLVRGAKIMAAFMSGIMLVLTAMMVFLKDKRAVDQLGNGVNDLKSTSYNLTNGIKSMAVLVTAFVGLMGAFAIVSTMSNGKIIQGLKIFGVVVSTITLLVLDMWLLKKATKDMGSVDTIIRISSMLASLYAMVGVIMLASKISNKDIIQGIKTFSVAFGSLIVLIGEMWLLDKALHNMEGTNSLIKVTAMLIPLYGMLGAFALLQKIKIRPGRILGTITLLAIMMPALAGLFKAVDLITKTISPMTLAYIGAMFASMYAMVGLIALLNSVTINAETWANAGKALGMFAAAFVIFMGITAGLSALVAVVPALAAGITVLVSLTAVLLGFALALKLFETMNVDAALENLLKFMNGLTEHKDEIVSGFTSMIYILLETIQNSIPMIIETVVKVVIAIIEAQAQYLDDYCKAIWNVLVAFWGELKKWLGKYIKFMKNDVVGLVWEFIKGIGETFWGFIGKVLSGIKDWFKQLFKDVKALIKGELSWKDLGLDLIKGMWEGIKDSAKWLKNKLVDWGKSIKNKVKDIFGIHSPSRFMMGIGEYLDMGLAKGLEEDINVINKPINTIANMIADGIDDQLTITPVMDLSEIQNGTNRMHSMISSMNGYSVNPSMANATYRSVDNRNTSVKAAETVPVTSGGDNYVLNNTFNITGNADPDDIADAVSKKIAEQITRRKTAWQ